jgi:hypothetical protein
MVRKRGKRTLVCVETAIRGRREGGKERERSDGQFLLRCVVSMCTLCVPVSD